MDFTLGLVVVVVILVVWCLVDVIQAIRRERQRDRYLMAYLKGELEQSKQPTYREMAQTSKSFLEYVRDITRR